jgi:transposase
VRVTSTTVTELFGVGPMTAAILIGNVGDIRRFRNRSSTPLAVASRTVCRGVATAR